MRNIKIISLFTIVSATIISCVESDTPSDIPPPLDPNANYIYASKIAQGIALRPNGKLAYALGVDGSWFEGKIDNIADITTGGIVLKNDGTVWQLLDSAGQLNPIQINGFSDIKAIALGVGPTIGYILALKTDGTVLAVGKNNYGQLGDNTYVDRTTPVTVEGLSGVVAISAGISAHSIALKDDGTIWGWGYNTSGELGASGLGSTVAKPQQINGFTDIISISAGNATTFGVKKDGTLWACGNNAASQLGTGSGVNTSTPTLVSGLENVTMVAATNLYTLALKGDSTVWAWGFNSYGNLGDGTTKQRATPVKVKYLTGIKYINTGSYAIEKNGICWAWGDNSYGQLHLKTYNTYVAYPKRVEQ